MVPSLVAGRAWLDRLTVDPFQLDARGLVGRVHLVEQLEAYAALMAVSSPTDAADIRGRVIEVAAPTRDPRWTPTDDGLRSGLIPWLRCAVLLDRMGLDVSGLVAAFQEEKKRFDGHLEKRSPAIRHQAHVAWLHFGLVEPTPLDDPAESGLLTRRPAVAAMKIAEAYELVHEITRRFDHGERWWAKLEPESLEWATSTLTELVGRYQARGNVDFVGVALAALGMLGQPVDSAWLVSRQNADGSWGDPARAAQRFGELAAPALLLHTTGAAIAAIAAAEVPFEARERRVEAARSALRRAGRWLDGFEVDPVALSNRGIPGKKILVEQLDSVRILWMIAPAEEKPALHARFAEIAACTRTRPYHDMLEVDARKFRAGSTSYLRAAWLCDKMGVDTTLYRDQIRLVKPRLDRHMSERGVHQLMVFRIYYRHFGLPEPFPFDQQPFGLLARRPDPATLSVEECYVLTHEVTVPALWGEIPYEHPFDDETRAWLRPTLVTLTRVWMSKVNADLLGEFLLCFWLQGWTDEPVYHDGLAWLVRQQNPDGSWGRLDRIRERYGDEGLWRVVVHTTGVCVETLAKTLQPFGGSVPIELGEHPA